MGVGAIVKWFLLGIFLLSIAGCTKSPGDVDTGDVKSKENQIKSASEKLNGPMENRGQDAGGQ